MDYNKVYGDLFNGREYNTHLNNEPRFEYVFNFLTHNEVITIGDFGSGRGNLIDLILSHKSTYELHSYDLKKFHMFEVPFSEINLCADQLNDIDIKYDLITCLDVMEHLDKDCVDRVLYFFSKNSHKTILTIANHSDVQNGVELHTIQENLNYWLPLIEKYYVVLDNKEEYNGRLYLLTLESKN